MYDLKRHIVDVPDFPRPGILFRDITPLLRSHFQRRSGALSKRCSARTSGARPMRWPASRVAGFILAAGLAARLDKGFVPIRKSGKLPPPVEAVDYALEYGSAVLELQRGSRPLLLIDDVVATGGTMAAAARLARAAGFRLAALPRWSICTCAGHSTGRACRCASVLSYD